jgi:hypothetical protein
MPRRHWAFGLVLAVDLVVRAWFAVSFPILQVSDYASYYEGARVVAGISDRKLDAMYPIFPKLWLGAVFRLFGDGLVVVGLANALLHGAALFLLYAGASRVFGRATALVAALLAVLSPSELYFTNLASSEVPGMFFIALIFFLMSAGRDDARASAVLGAAGGLAVYNRSNILPMGALSLAHDLLLGRRAAASVKRALLVQLVTLGVTLPLCLFNLRHFGRFTPLVANSQTLWFGNNPKLRGDAHQYAELPEYYPAGSTRRAQLKKEYASFYVNPDADADTKRMGSYELTDLNVRYGMAWIRHHPRRYLELIVARFQLFFFTCTYGEAPYRSVGDARSPGQPSWTPQHERLLAAARLPVRSAYQVLLAGAALGLAATISSTGRQFFSSLAGLPLTIVAFYTAPFLLMIGVNRHHIPILCLCWVYLAHGLVLLGRRCRASLLPRTLAEA